MNEMLNNLRSWWEKNQPDFWRGMSARYRAAATIALIVVAWIATGVFNGGYKPESTDAASASTLPRVQVTTLNAQLRAASVTVRGRTQALHAVDIRAEVDGVVAAIRAEKGQKVKAGDVVCEIKLNDRGAKMAQANAMVAQTAKEQQVAAQLFKEGFRSKTQMAQAEAAYAAARAQAQAAGVALGNTKIRAPFDGYVDDRYVEVGDYMKVGDRCALVIAPEPFLAVGSVSEQEVGALREGNPAIASLVTGEKVQGKVRFVADRAAQTTRTFRVEVELPNRDNRLRDGVSAEISIPVKQIKAHHLSPGVLVLDDSGVVGVRIVQNGVVHFVPVQIISDSPEGMWVAGLPEHVRVITVGQEFVSNGQRVQAIESGKTKS
jgi:multidrug efflux system membrane fusion protein